MVLRKISFTHVIWVQFSGIELGGFGLCDPLEKCME